MVRPIRPYTFSISDFCFHSLGHLFNKQHYNHPDGAKEYCLEHLGVTPRISHVLPWQNAFVKGTYLLAVATEAISQALLPGPYLVEGSQHETRQCGNGQVVEIVQYPGKNP